MKLALALILALFTSTASAATYQVDVVGSFQTATLGQFTYDVQSSAFDWYRDAEYARATSGSALVTGRKVSECTGLLYYACAWGGVTVLQPDYFQSGDAYGYSYFTPTAIWHTNDSGYFFDGNFNVGIVLTGVATSLSVNQVWLAESVWFLLIALGFYAWLYRATRFRRTGQAA